MSEEKQEVRPVSFQWRCNACEKGFMFANKNKKPREQAPKYPHICNACRREQHLDKAYPYIGFEPILIKP